MTWVLLPLLPIEYRTYSAKTVRIRQDLDAICTQSAITAMKNFSKSFPFITTASQSSGHHPDAVQTTQDIVTILIRYSRICHEIVTIVIRLDKIGWVSRQRREAPNCRETWPTSQDLSRSAGLCRTLLGLCYERIRLRSVNDRTFQIIEDCNPTFSLFVS